MSPLSESRIREALDALADRVPAEPVDDPYNAPVPGDHPQGRQRMILRVMAAAAAVAIVAAGASAWRATSSEPSDGGQTPAYAASGAPEATSVGATLRIDGLELVDTSRSEVPSDVGAPPAPGEITVWSRGQESVVVAVRGPGEATSLDGLAALADTSLASDRDGVAHAAPTENTYGLSVSTWAEGDEQVILATRGLDEAAHAAQVERGREAPDGFEPGYDGPDLNPFAIQVPLSSAAYRDANGAPVSVRWVRSTDGALADYAWFLDATDTTVDDSGAIEATVAGRSFVAIGYGDSLVVVSGASGGASAVRSGVEFLDASAWDAASSAASDPGSQFQTSETGG